MDGVGRVNFILDNLIAQVKAKPMIVVMPLGYGALDMVRQGWSAWNDQGLQSLNFRKFSEALLSEIMPRVESRYRIVKDREARAIAGLSMGGAESLLTGLNNLDAVRLGRLLQRRRPPYDFQSDFRSLDAKSNEALRLLWISCGTEDDLLYVSRSLRLWLEQKEVRHLFVETPGAHAWMVWRRNVAEFAGRLFK